MLMLMRYPENERNEEYTLTPRPADVYNAKEGEKIGEMLRSNLIALRQSNFI